MTVHHICSNCGSPALLVVHDVIVRRLPTDPPDAPPSITFDAFVCESCRFTEIYATSPLEVDGRVVEHVGDPVEEESGFYEDWPPPEDLDDELLENDWADADVEITEVSRVEKKPESRFGAKVVLTDIGARPADVLRLLRGTLGLSIPNERWLESALPYVVLDLISNDAARGLEKMLVEAGATAEVRTRNDQPP